VDAKLELLLADSVIYGESFADHIAGYAVSEHESFLFGAGQGRH